MKFKTHDIVVHKATGNPYRILAEPTPTRLLEEGSKQFYSYQGECGVGSAPTEDYPIWYRCQREMEDGRFVTSAAWAELQREEANVAKMVTDEYADDRYLEDEEDEDDIYDAVAKVRQREEEARKALGYNLQDPTDYKVS